MKNPTFSYSWKGREEDLNALKRYGKFDVMFYRTNLAIHKERVKAISKLLMSAVKLPKDFDVIKQQLISEHHDDYELILEDGDISLQLKLMMNEKEHSDLLQKEIAAAERMAEFYPKSVKGYKYLQLLLHSIHKDCAEAQLHSFADKIDGYCEAIHEVLAGNIIFLEPVINYHTKTFNDLCKKFPLILELFTQNDNKGNLFNFSIVDLKEYFRNARIGAKPYTPEAVLKETGIPHYESWKKVTLSAFPNGMELLTKQTEFHEE